MKKKRIHYKELRIAESYRSGGIGDYVAARILLEHKMLLQGATLACTAVEKYLKYIYIFEGLKLKGHLNNLSQIKLKEISSKFKINLDFLKLLQIIYQVRYIDNLKQEVSFSIERLKFLAELDSVIKNLSDVVKLYDNNGKLLSSYNSVVNSKKHDISNENWIISGVEKKQFVSQPDIAQAFFIDTSLTVSCDLSGYIPKDLESFSLAGIIKDGDSYKCILGK